jgi:tRNA modification GTPase
MPAADTIVAVSSSPGRSPRALIRVSGPAARAALDSILASPYHLASTASSGGLAFSRLRPPLPDLPITLACFSGPRSYTGDDLIEIQCPGHPGLLERLLHALTQQAATRLAQPGEFTFRAFTAGKLDLTQAEGVAATIAATSSAQLHAAHALRDGQLGRLAAALSEHLATHLALVEAGIDFTDQEDVTPITPAALDAALQWTDARLDDLLRNSQRFANLAAPPRVVLVGPPSVGKSTLFNALLGRPRALTSPTPGTTRDALEESLTLTTPAGLPLDILLIDLPGLDSPHAALDHDIQQHAHHVIATADLILQLQVSGDRSPVSAHPQSAIRDQPSSLHIRTQSDLPSLQAEGFSPGCSPPPTPAPPHFDLAVSAHTGHHLDALRRLIAQKLAAQAHTTTGEALALQPRHEAALRAAAAALADARALLAPHVSESRLPGLELLAAALRAALDHLTALTGRLTPDDILGRIFASFCIGK